MTTTREDPPAKANGTDTPKDPAPSQASDEPKPPGKKIDPWHFGAHTVPPGLRAQLSAIELPDAPQDRRYRPLAAAATSTDSPTTGPNEQLPAARRDFRKPVAMGLAVLVLFFGAVALFRSLGNGAGHGPVAAPSTASSPPERAPTPTLTQTEPQTTPSTTMPTTPPPAASSEPPQHDIGARPGIPSAKPKPGSTHRLEVPASPAVGVTNPPLAPSAPPGSSRVVPPDD